MASRNLKFVRVTAAALIVVAVVVRVALTRLDEAPRTARIPTQVAHDDFDFSQASVGGCGDIFLYKQAGTNVLSVHLTFPKSDPNASLRAFLNRAGRRKFAETQFDLSSLTDGLRVEIQMWDGAPRFCDCIPTKAKMTTAWIAKSGKLTITAHGPAKGPNSDCYLVSALLEDVVFENEQGRQVMLRKESIPEIAVGWYAG